MFGLTSPVSPGAIVICLETRLRRTFTLFSFHCDGKTDFVGTLCRRFANCRHHAMCTYCRWGKLCGILVIRKSSFICMLFVWFCTVIYSQGGLQFSFFLQQHTKMFNKWWLMASKNVSLEETHRYAIRNDRNVLKHLSIEKGRDLSFLAASCWRDILKTMISVWSICNKTEQSTESQAFAGSVNIVALCCLDADAFKQR